MADTNKLNEDLLIKCSTASKSDIKKILDDGADINSIIPAYGFAPLHHVADGGNVETAEFLINQCKADIEIRDKRGKTPLDHAATNGNTDMVKLLIDLGANVNSVDNDGDTPLLNVLDLLARLCIDHDADHEVVSLLLENGANMEFSDKYGKTALLIAIKHGRADMVKLLIRSGATIEVKDHDGNSPLEGAICFDFKDVDNKRTEIVAALLENGANVEILNKDGETPLFGAVKYGRPDIVKLLIHSGANIEFHNHDGETPLQRSIYPHMFDPEIEDNKRKEVVAILLDNGANVEVVDKYQKTPLHHARSADTAELLIIHKADIESRSEYGSTPLHCAASLGNADIVEVLIKSGANLNPQNNAMEDPLPHIYNAIQPLKDIITRDTPLHHAARGGYADVVRVLLQYGADKRVRNLSNETPLDLAREKGHHNIVQLLEEGFAVSKVTDVEVTWNIDNLNEEQVFEKPEFGVKLVIPSSSVQEDQSIDTTVQIVDSDLALPPNVEPVSCFYKITSQMFIEPIDLYVQHNVDLSVCDNRRLAFVTSSGSPPYELEFYDEYQAFDPNDNSGVVRISHFSTHVFGIVWKVFDAVGDMLSPVTSYAMTPFYKQMNDNCWQIKVVVTQNLGPFFEKLKMSYSGWMCGNPGSFLFHSDVNTVTMNENNELFKLSSLKSPNKINKKEVDKCSIDSLVLHDLHYKVESLSSSISDLKLEFIGMSEEMVTVTITKEELCTSSAVQANSIEIMLSKEILDMEPTMKHLTSQLHPIKCDWRSVGVQLNISDSSLKSFEYETRYNDTMRLANVLQEWINCRSTKVSWKTILDVIKDPPISNLKLLESLQKFLLRHDIQCSYLSPDANNNSPKSTFGTLPSLKSNSKVVKPDTEAEPQDSITGNDDTKAEPQDSVTGTDDTKAEPQDSVTGTDDTKAEPQDSVTGNDDTKAEPQDSVTDGMHETEPEVQNKGNLTLVSPVTTDEPRGIPVVSKESLLLVVTIATSILAVAFIYWRFKRQLT